MLEEIHIEGFKSIRSQVVRLEKINVLLGANGAGKSNLVDCFRLLQFLHTGSLGLFVGRSGGANSLLHFGAKQTPELRFHLQFAANPQRGVQNGYTIRLSHGAPDRLVFAQETVAIKWPGQDTPKVVELGSGQSESRLEESEDHHDLSCRLVLDALKRMKNYHFHDTTPEAPIRQTVAVDNDSYLRARGENLAGFLHRLQRDSRDYYDRIVGTMRDVAPYFRDFVLADPGDTRRGYQLRWRSTHSEYEFGPQQLSDGSLRFLALATLLLQPESDLPEIIVLDEPELGLHPYAIRLLAGLIRSASQTAQVILATQSTAFLDEFDAEDVIIVEQVDGESRFSRLPIEELAPWLDEYSLSEVWCKNLLGGRPR